MSCSIFIEFKDFAPINRFVIITGSYSFIIHCLLLPKPKTASLSEAICSSCLVISSNLVIEERRVVGKSRLFSVSAR